MSRTERDDEMGEKAYEALIACGFDRKEAMERFMENEALLERFLGKFVDDETYETLCRAMRAGDNEEAFRAVHTLKGVTGNLALHGLYDACCGLTEVLRGAPDMDAARAAGADEAFARLGESYEATLQAIKALV